ncbi:hypothetical protein C8Z91_07320 [Paenibacillus elgii]|uniref:Blue (type 1) copper domain-containing protein n=2 Tax=Paenibacillus elgii TaxID=189691 RepID=A0A2T6G6T9_9BACL|nr:hypothetical protein C8Z91_07320 [Paenibacillus elgii]
MMNKHWKRAVLLLGSALTISTSANAATPADNSKATAVAVKTDAQIAAELGVLQGDGSGVTASYLSQSTTRLQAAILFLRLQGLESEALGFKGSANFDDAGAVNESNQAALGYLKANPQLGWTGTGAGRFEPMDSITAQQYYKVILESLGYKQDTDFAFADTIRFAEGKGLKKIAEEGNLNNGHIATATVEALGAKLKAGDKTLLDTLVGQKVVTAEAAAAAAASSVRLATNDKVGTYLTDGSGKALYTFTKDAPFQSACKDQCTVNWPVFKAESLQLPPSLKIEDFGVITREDGTKQTTYKGSPLYYFLKDTKAGDVNGQGVNNVWFAAKPEGVSPKQEDKQAAASKEYQVQMAGFAFSAKELTVEAGSKVTFTNKDKVKHNAVSDTLGDNGKPVFETKLLGEGESETITLTKPGTYTYYCAPHKAEMKATIIVK